MHFSLSFRAQCVLRVLAIALTMLLLVYLVSATTLYASATIVAVACGLQVWGLVWYIERTNRELVRFLEAVRFGDASQTWSSTRFRSASFQDLAQAFTRVLGEFQKIRVEKEEQYHAVQRIVQHVGTGLLAFDDDGTIDFINPAAQRLLGVGFIPHLAAIPHDALRTTMRGLKSGERALVRLLGDDDEQQLVLTATKYRVSPRGLSAATDVATDVATDAAGSDAAPAAPANASVRLTSAREWTLISLQNIVGELEEKELEAWQTLIRVLTHEMMNSIAPITSLAATIAQTLDVTERPEDISDDDLDDMRLAVNAIRRRSEGLMSFVENYRNLTRIPKPQFEIVRIDELFAHVRTLLRDRLEASGIALRVVLHPQELTVVADAHLLEQVLLNLCINAIHAVEAKKHSQATSQAASQAASQATSQAALEAASDVIAQAARVVLSAAVSSRGRVMLDVSDSGVGIAQEALDKIFIPFFTTKPDGSGIGLSFARQVMMQHGGSISVSSELDKGTTFRLRF
jgi:two-component system, NtrC family, nitrogen regulation sensor histidine kinase NtrY